MSRSSRRTPWPWRLLRLLLKTLFWFLLLLAVLYLVGVRFVAPWWLQQNLPSLLEEEFGWKVTVGAIRLDPMALVVDIEAFKARDAAGEVVRLERLWLELAPQPLLQGQIQLEKLRFIQPFLRLDLLEGGQLSLVKRWQKRHPPAKKSAGSVPIIRLVQGRIEGGEVLIRDLSRTPLLSRRITSLDLELNQLATRRRKGDPQGDYALVLQVEDGSRLASAGRLQAVPLALSGQLTLENLQSQTLLPWFEAYLPWTLQKARLSAGLSFELDAIGPFDLSLSQGEIRLQDLALALPDTEQPALQLAQLELTGLVFDLTDRRLALETLQGQGLDLLLTREKDGELDLLRPLRNQVAADAVSQAAAEPSAGEAAPSQPWNWSLPSLLLTDSRLLWRDLSLSSPGEIALQQLRLEITDLSSSADKPFQYGLQLQPGGQGRLQLDGQVTRQPLTLSAAVDLRDLALSPLRPWWDQQLDLAVAEGVAHLQGQLDLEQLPERLDGGFGGQLTLEGVKAGQGGETLMSWAALRLDPLQMRFDPLQVDVGTLRLDQPDFSLALQEDGQINLARLLRKPVPPARDAWLPVDAQPTKTESAAPVLRLDHLEISGGQATLMDRTVKPAFISRVQDLQGSLTGLSNEAPQRARLELQGRIDDTGLLKVKGDLAALGSSGRSEVQLQLDNLSLPALSPYTGRYLGYFLDRGKLGLRLNYVLDGQALTAGNRVILDQVALGSSVASEDALSMPLALALPLLKNRKGVIELDLPVAGNLNDPRFSLTGVMTQTLMNVVVKAAAAPFTLLGSLTDLAGFTGEQLAQVRFQPGQASLVDGEADKLVALADALQQRESLVLNIRGVAHPELDATALALPPGAEAEEALRALARARGRGLQQALVSRGLDPAQIFLREPALNAKVSEGSVIVDFSIGTR